MRPWFDSWVREIPWRRDRLPTPVFLDFPGDSAGKESTRNAGDLGSIPGLGRALEKGMATHPSVLAWRIPRTEEPGRLQSKSMGLQRLGRDWVTKHTHLMPMKFKSIYNWQRSLRSAYFSLVIHFIIQRNFLVKAEAYFWTFWSKQKHISVFRRVYSFYKVMKRGVRLY